VGFLIITFKFQIQKLIQFNSIQFICFRPQESIPVVTNNGQTERWQNRHRRDGQNTLMM